MRPVFALPGYALVGACGFLGFSALWRKNASAPRVACVLSVMAFAGWLMWRSANSPDVWLGQNYLRLILACLVVYLIFAFALTNPIHRLIFIIGLMALASIQAVLEVWQFNHPHDSFPLPWFSEQLKIWYGSRFGTRSHGFYLNQNHLAWFLNASGLFALSATCWGRWSLTTKIVTLYVALMSFGGSILTASRGGALGLAAGLTVFVLLSGMVIVIGSRHRRKIALIVLLSGIVATAGTVALVFKTSELVEGRFSGLLDDSYRPSLFEVALRQFQISPIYGGGAGSFSFDACRFRTMMNDAADDIYAHNDWAQMFSDFGVPAGLLLILVVLLHSRGGVDSLLTVLRERMSSSSRAQSHAAALLMAALSCLAVFVVESVFDFNMQIPVNALLAAACLGMIANSGITAGRASPKTSMKLRFGGCLLTAFGGAVLLALTSRAVQPEMAWLRAENAFFTGRQKDALRFVQDGLSKDLIHPPFCRLAGLIFIAANRTSDSPWERLDNMQNAIQVFSRATVDSPQDWKNFLLLGIGIKGSGKLRLADEQAIESIRLNLTQGSGYDLYANCLVQENRLEEALGVYLRASQVVGETHARQNAEQLKRRIKVAVSPESPK